LDTLNNFSNDWNLGTLANYLEIVGFAISLGAFILSWIVKSKVDKLRSEHLFDNRVNAHLKKLDESAAEISRLLNNYNRSRDLIKVEFGLCIAELQDIYIKLSPTQGKKCKSLIAFLKQRKNKTFISKLRIGSIRQQFWAKNVLSHFQTTDDDVWIAYMGLREVIRQLENIKLNRNKSK
jgi:hypothetical protein